jgi:hypothetical protein
MVAATSLRCTAVTGEGAAREGVDFARISRDSWHDQGEIQDLWYRRTL